MPVTVTENILNIPKELRGEMQQAGKVMAKRMERIVKARLALGDPDQPPYSTTPSLYSVSRPYGGKGKFVAYMRSQGMTAKEAQSRPMVFLPMGYAQFRAIYRGTSINPNKVTFNLTGAFVKALRGRRQLSPSKNSVRVWLGFRRQQRSYGTLTNEQLMEVLNKRGSAPAIALKPHERDVVIEQAVRQITSKL